MSSEPDAPRRRARAARRAPVVIRGGSSALAEPDAGSPAVVASYCEETHVVLLDSGAGAGDAAGPPQMDGATWVMAGLDAAAVGCAAADNTVVCLPASRHAAATRGAEGTAAMTIGAGSGGKTPVSGRG